ncbi:MAG: DUF4258 domain-containing protein [Patescibacteria group bacterium]
MNIDLIRVKVLAGEWDLSHHAHKERQAEKITLDEIKHALLKGDIIERYSKDPRGSSCLLCTETVHVVCGMRESKLLVVTNYRPQPPVWKDYKTRTKELKSRG